MSGTPRGKKRSAAEPYAEFGDGLSAEAAGLQVFARMCSLGTLQLLLEKRARPLMDLDQAATLLGLPRLFR